MFILNLVILCVIALINCNEENCTRIHINDDKIRGECCVFIRDEDLRHEDSHVLEAIVKDSVSSVESHQVSQPSLDQRMERIHLIPNNIPPRPTAGHIRREVQTADMPVPLENIVIPINHDKVYGECNVLMKNEGNLPPEEREPPPNERIQRTQSVEPPPDSPTVGHPKPGIQKQHPRHKLDKKINHNHRHNNSYIDITAPDLDEAIGVPTARADLEISSTDSSSKIKGSHKHKVKNSTNLEQQTSSSAFPIVAKTDKHVLKDLNEDDHSDIFFPTEESIVTTIKSSNFSSGNETNFGKKTIEFDNRNAVDVPPIRCPSGQTKDPSGNCVLPF